MTIDPVPLLIELVDTARASGRSLTEIAADIGAPASLVCHWQTRRTKPGATYRDAIEIWSRGRIQASFWRDDDEIDALKRVRLLPKAIVDALPPVTASEPQDPEQPVRAP